MQPMTEPHPSAASHIIEPAQIQFIEATFREFLGDRQTDDESLKAWRRDSICWIHQKLFQERMPVATVRAELSRAARRTRTIAVTSGKGGVGKTAVAVNLAVACAQTGARVLLFDADFGMANVHIYAGVNPSVTLLDVVDGRVPFADAIIPGPGGVQLICGASGITRMSNLSTPVIEALGRELLRVAAAFDVLVIDTGAGISFSVTHFLSLAQDSLVIATPGLASTLDAYGVIKLAHENRLATRIHLLINQTEEEQQAGRVLDRIAGCANRFLNSSLHSLGFLDRDPTIERSTQSRRPLVLSDPANPNAQRIAAIAAQFLEADASDRNAASGSEKTSAAA